MSQPPDLGNFLDGGSLELGRHMQNLGRVPACEGTIAILNSIIIQVAELQSQAASISGLTALLYIFLELEQNIAINKHRQEGKT